MRRHSPEAFQQARADLRHDGDDPRPASARGDRHASGDAADRLRLHAALRAAQPAAARRSTAHVEDRLGLIHHCLNAYRLRNGRPNVDMPYWGAHACCGCDTCQSSVTDGCHWPCPDECCHLPSPYRFVFLLQKAQELASARPRVRRGAAGRVRKGRRRVPGVAARRPRASSC